VSSIRNTFFVLQSLYNFIEKSTKRHAIFENIKKSFQSFSGGTSTLESLSDTRWACRVEVVRSLLDNFDTTLTTLREISDTDPDNGGQANTLLKNLEDFNFVFDLLLLRRVLTQCDILSKTLQSSSVTYEIMKSVKNKTAHLKYWNSSEQMSFSQSCSITLQKLLTSADLELASCQDREKSPRKLGEKVKPQLNL